MDSVLEGPIYLHRRTKHTKTLPGFFPLFFLTLLLRFPLLVLLGSMLRLLTAKKKEHKKKKRIPGMKRRVSVVVFEEAETDH